MDVFTYFIIYLFYGAAFFAMGVAIVSRLKTFATLQIAGFFWLLALFGFTHGGHEWLELFLVMAVGGEELRLQVRYVSLLLLLASFLFLFFFGINLQRVLAPRTRPYLLALFMLLTGGFLVMLVHQLTPQPNLQLEVIDSSIRHFFAIPAGLLTGCGFIIYARRLQTLSSTGAGNFVGAGLAFLVYALFSGFFSSDTTIAQLPIQFWRGLTAFVILHFIMYALDNFLYERNALVSQRLRQISHSEKLASIGRLAAGVAHEINNPLANASLQLELLQKEAAVSTMTDRNRRRLENIQRSVAKSAHIAGQLLIFAGRHGDQALPEPVNLAFTVDQAWQTLSHRNSRHQLANFLPPQLIVPGFALKLEQLFTNIFHNALDAAPPGGTITVNGGKDKDQVIITVNDQGEGMDHEQRNLAMDPFYTTKDAGHGSGLGLSICYGIMIEHGGEINLLPRPDGRGTTVKLVFPVDLPGFRQKHERGEVTTHDQDSDRR